jgi:multidrug efflux pump subunit AcrA (membrane-fusion protein)
MSARQRYLLLAVLLAAVLLVISAPEQEPELREAVATRVRVAAVGRHDLVPSEVVSGRLEPARKAALHIELAGQVEERAVEPGQTVAEGALLLALDAGDYVDALAEAEAQFVQEQRNIERDRELLKLARQNYVLRQNDLQRLEKLGIDSLVSASRLDESRMQLIQLESELAQLKASTGTADARLAMKQAARNRAARNLERTRLKAPFAGTVNSVNVQVGDYVTPAQQVVDLVDAATLDMYVEVRGEVMQSLSQGQHVGVEVDGNSLPGEVLAMQLDPDPVTFTHALRIRLPGNGAHPGQVAEVRLPLQVLQQVLAVPATAVLYEEGQTFVFRVSSDTLERVEVVLGRRVGEWLEVRRGIDADDLVVMRDVAALSDGQKVTVELLAGS